ncbi:MAG: tripartite tricarboxylate transporter substrate binding protein [Hyphomicrobiales bacterium]|nr:MAG: tripartite tricarboxylate transporter substrate binding protein [Hyphomicrobiales bacterium]
MMRIALQALAAWAVLMSGAACAQTYPARPITLIVTFPPGGSADLVARAMENKLGADLGAPVVIENRPGAGGNIGIAAVAKAQPDGYTLGIAAAGVLAVNQHLGRSMGFDPQKDLAPVTLLSIIPFVLVAADAAPVKSVADILETSRAAPEKLTIGHGGNGTAMHLSAALFTQMTGAKIPLVAYRGSGPAANDVLAGHIGLAVLDLPASLELVRAKRIRPIGVTSTKRLATLPDVPTLSESGVAGYDSVGWFGIVAPAGTPPSIIARLNDAFVKALRDKDVAEKISALGAEPAPSSVEEFRSFIAAENGKWSKLIAEAGIKGE